MQRCGAMGSADDSRENREEKEMCQWEARLKTTWQRIGSRASTVLQQPLSAVPVTALECIGNAVGKYTQVRACVRAREGGREGKKERICQDVPWHSLNLLHLAYRCPRCSSWPCVNATDWENVAAEAAAGAAAAVAAAATATALCLTMRTHTQMHVLKLMSSQLQRLPSIAISNKNTDLVHE